MNSNQADHPYVFMAIVGSLFLAAHVLSSFGRRPAPVTASKDQVVQAAVLPPKLPDPPPGVTAHTLSREPGVIVERWWLAGQRQNMNSYAVALFPTGTFQFKFGVGAPPLSFWQIIDQSETVVASSEEPPSSEFRGVKLTGYPDTVRLGNGPLLEPNPLNFMVNVTLPKRVRGAYRVRLLYNYPGYTAKDWLKEGQLQGGGYEGTFNTP
ncbi:MAG: hypothetical protein P4L33_17710 [Capsulimonadaceae bacterium]|nr:hypothetical protein [Capsulimonadaceae bacterium]